MNNDWVFYLSSLLAYSVLFSIVPLALVVLALAVYVLQPVSPATTSNLIAFVKGALPGGAANTVVDTALKNLDAARPIFLVGLAASIFAGSRLFIVIENAFGIIFRLPSRAWLRQNIMAFSMLAVYLALVPVIFFTSTLPSLLGAALFPDGGTLADLAGRGIGLGAALLSAALLFGAIYVIVPNRPVRWREVWRGTLVSAALLVLYQQLFPLYVSLFLKPDNFGTILGFAVVIIIFFYYVAFILLLGAEVNAWAGGVSATPEDIPTLLYDVLVRHTVPRGILIRPTMSEKPTEV